MSTFDARAETHGMFDHCNHPATDHGTLCDHLTAVLQRAYAAGRADALGERDAAPSGGARARAWDGFVRLWNEFLPDDNTEASMRSFARILGEYVDGFTARPVAPETRAGTLADNEALINRLVKAMYGTGAPELNPLCQAGERDRLRVIDAFLAETRAGEAGLLHEACVILDEARLTITRDRQERWRPTGIEVRICTFLQRPEVASLALKGLPPLSATPPSAPVAPGTPRPTEVRHDVGTWNAVALAYGYNELIRKLDAPTLGQKLYLRFMGDAAIAEAAKLGFEVKVDNATNPVVLSVDCPPVHLNFRESDVEAMRAFLAARDAKAPPASPVTGEVRVDPRAVAGSVWHYESEGVAFTASQNFTVDEAQTRVLWVTWQNGGKGAWPMVDFMKAIALGVITFVRSPSASPGEDEGPRVPPEKGDVWRRRGTNWTFSGRFSEGSYDAYDGVVNTWFYPSEFTDGALTFVRRGPRTDK